MVKQKEISISDAVKPNNSKIYVLAVVAIVLISAASIVAVEWLNPDKDNSLIITAILGFITPTMASIFSFLKAQETHLMVNSRLTEFMQNSEKAALARGRDEGRVLANERTDALAAKKKKTK